MDKPENLTAVEFFRFDLRAGTILSIEEVPKSKKLLKLEVDFGPAGKRTILGGIASALPDRVIVGQKVVAVINFEPRSMMGQTSHGMLLASTDADGKIWLVNPGPVPDGAEVG